MRSAPTAFVGCSPSGFRSPSTTYERKLSDSFRELLSNTDFCTVGLMKTTLNLQDELMVRMKAVAAQEHTTLTRLVEEGLALRLRRKKTPMSGVLKELPLSRCQSGLREGINGDSNRSLLDAADE